MKVRCVLAILCLLLGVGFSVEQVFALTDSEYQRINSYDGRFYKPGTATNSSGGQSSCASNMYNGAGLSESAIKKLQGIAILNNIPEGNMEAYLYAAQQTGVMWQAIAALHFTEGGMGSDRSLLNGEPLNSGINVDGMMVGTTLKEDAVFAAQHLVHTYNTVYRGISDTSKYVTPVTADDHGWAFLAYGRGYMYQVNNVHYDKSTMVMNFYDDAHWNMKWLYEDSYMGAKKYNTLYDASTNSGKTNANPGKLTVMTYLVGLTNTGSSGFTVDTCRYSVKAVDGKVFPIGGATKSNLLTNANFGSGTSVLSQPPGWYHHPSKVNPSYMYSAADIGIMIETHAEPEYKGCGKPSTFHQEYCAASFGAPVVAISDGTVAYYSHYTNGTPADWVSRCAQLGFVGDDGTSYWYGHLMYEDAYSIPGAKVSAGDVIGHIGMPQCAMGTQSHLDIHISKPIFEDPRITDIIKSTYEVLPE